MQGVILGVGAQSLIRGDDGRRYTFTRLEWQDDGVTPEAGMRVDFDVRGSEAADIYPIPGAAPAPQAQAPVRPAPKKRFEVRSWREMERSQRALAGGGALIALAVVAALALAVFWPSGPPIGREIARHTHDGRTYILVEYGNELALFSRSGAPVTQRSLAEAVLRSYAWRQVVVGFDAEELADVSQKARNLDDSVSGIRRLSNGVVAIFDQLDGLKANLPLVGSISAMDVVRNSFDGVEDAEILVRKLDSELDALEDNAATLAGASRRILGVEPASVSGREMESLFAEASGAARDLESSAREVKDFVADGGKLVARLERALRSVSNTPVIGGTLGSFARTVGRFGDELSGLSSLLGGFESELGSLAKNMENGLKSAKKTLQADMKRWLEEPYDTEWPPTDPERRPAGITRAPPTDTPVHTGTTNRERGAPQSSFPRWRGRPSCPFPLDGGRLGWG